MPSEAEWFRTARRWGQITVRENEVTQVNVAEWADFWQRCRLDAVVLNAGGYLAAYPTRIPLHRPSPSRQDLFGELVQAARNAGIRVVGRLNPSRAVPEVYYARPDWFFLGADGQPRRSDDRFGSYFTCINTPYYWEQIPLIIGELMEKYDLDGFWGEEWQGYGLLGLKEPCHCAACREKYRLQRSADLPTTSDLNDPEFRVWEEWRQQNVSEVWTHWEDTLKLFKRGITWVGPDAVEALAEGADLLASVSPIGDAPIAGVGVKGRAMRAVAGNDKRSVQVVNAFDNGRHLSRPSAQLTAMLAECAASGSSPCFQFASAVLEDRRAMKPVEEFYRWHAENESFLTDGLESAAAVAVIVSDRTARFYYGQDDAVTPPAAGFMAALSQAGIPFDVLPDTQITYQRLKRYRTVVLPNVACLSQDACEILWEFGSDGGGLVATYETSVYDENGKSREDYGMTDRLGVKLMRPVGIGPIWPESYFRVAQRHEMLEGFEETSLLPGGGRFLSVELLMDHKTPLTVLPPSPCDPPEAAYVNASSVQAPAMVLGPSGRGRVVYFPTEPDRLYHEHGMEDHARLLANAVRWAAKEPLPVEVSGTGRKDVITYRKGEEFILHLVNLSGDAPGAQMTPLPSQEIRLNGAEYREVRLLVGSGEAQISSAEGQTVIRIPEVGVHEVVVIR